MRPQHEIFRGEQTPKTDIDKKTGMLIASAKRDALKRISKRELGIKPEVNERITNALERRLGPYIKESEIIAKQLATPEYRDFVTETKAFLDTSVGVIACPDGRILAAALTDPRVGRVHRRLQGKPEFARSEHLSTVDKNVYIVDDPMMDAAITTSVQERQAQGDHKAVTVELIGPHIDSMHPDHGCGGGAQAVSKNGRPKVTAMKYGAVPEYFETVGPSFDTTFNNTIAAAGGKGWTLDMTHDAHSQGLIFGLRYQLWGTGTAPLRDALTKLHQDGDILMTELLDPHLQETITAAAQDRGITSPLQIRNPEHFAQNMITVGEIAREITQEYEENGLPTWFQFPTDLLPGIKHAPEGPTQDIKDIKLTEDMPEDITENVKRTFIYHAIRNCVYRQLGDIKPGEHDLQEHPEQVIRVGPIGADFNVQTIPFSEVTPHGLLRQQDIEGAQALYGLSEGILPTLGVDLAKEARVIIVTGEYNEADYSSEGAKLKALAKVTSEVKHNVHTLCEVFEEGIINGETVVIGALHDAESREMTHVLPTAA